MIPINLSTKLKESANCKLLAQNSFNLEGLHATSYPYFQSFSPRANEALKRYLVSEIIHSVYFVKNAYIIVFRWPTGELLNLILVDNILLIHHHQHNWIKFYPFICQQGDSYFFDDSFFRLSNDYKQMFNYLMLGRDHWGHFVIDYLSRYSMTQSVLGWSPDVLCLPFERFQNQITKLFSNFSSSNLKFLPVPSFSSIIQVKNIICSDISAPIPFLNHSCNNFSININNSPALIGLVEAEGSVQRISNYDEIKSKLIKHYSDNLIFINPFEVNCKSNANVYAECMIIICPHGSTMLNPLIYSDRPILGLFPHSLFTDNAHLCDIEQYSDIVMLFGSRIFPFMSESLNRPDKFEPNYAINTPHFYNSEKLSSYTNFLCSKFSVQQSIE